MIQILIITHGLLANELRTTAESIVGRQEEVYTISLGQSGSLSTVAGQVQEVLGKIQNDSGTLILTDMLGGTPCNACLPLSATHSIEIVCGVNLYMLISAFMSRKELSLTELAKKVIEDGIKSIANAKEIFLKKLK